MAKRYFTPELFAFLRDLGSNNDREWFNANKDRYESTVRQPALDFITDFADRLGGISPHFVADARTVGGSLFRIHRDTRFSKDKTPYKTNTGVHFRHENARDAHAPGFYLHLEPRNCFMGAGMWRPETKVAYEVRHHIADHQDRWTAATTAAGFADRFELGGDSLSRPPRGFDAEHPLIDDLKRKDFIAVQQVKQGDVTRADFIERFAEDCRRSSDYVHFLCDAVGVDF